MRTRPGFFFEYSINSAKFLYGALLRTTSTVGVREAVPSGTRSRSES
jgi:hypothetical protein